MPGAQAAWHHFPRTHKARLCQFDANAHLQLVSWSNTVRLEIRSHGRGMGVHRPAKH